MRKVITMMLALTLGATLLAGCGSSPKETGTTATGSSVSAADLANADVPEGSYVISVQDEESGSPIEGVMIQFCSDTECRSEKSDASGKAVFEADPGDYTVHVLKAPEGYEVSSEEYDLTPETRTALIKLKKETETTDSVDEKPAEDEAGYTKASASWDFKNAGFTLKLPEDFKDCKGQLLADDYGEINFGSGVVWGAMGYLGRTDEDHSSALAKIAGLDFEGDPEGSAQKAEEISTEYYSVGILPVFLVAGIKNGMELDDVIASTLNADDIIKTVELGEAGSYKFYYIVQDPDVVTAAYKEIDSEEMLDEYRSLVARADEIAAAITVKEPAIKTVGPEIGSVISFETTDLDGNPVKSEDLFAGHKVTMINVWATWCTHCIIELPDLEELSKELEEKDCQLIGLCDDALGGDEAIIKEAKRILGENGVTYTSVVQTQELQNTLQLTAFPTTFFVDSEGRVLTQPVVGRDIAQYRARIAEALELVG